MKKIIIAIVILLITQTRLISQNCTPNPAAQNCETGKGISTNPNNPVNPECTNLVNNFDWRVKHTPGGNVPAERFWVYYDDDLNPTWIRNPFNGPINADYGSLTDNHNSNYHPEDGWELLKVEFGSMGNIGLGFDVQPGPNTISNERPKLPYMILYNKYSGTMRFFGSLLEPNNTYQTVRIELRIPKESPTTPQNPNNVYDPDLKATNLLSIQGETVQPLDQETDESSIAVFVKYTNNPELFFWFDLPVAYDPCVCNNKVQLDVSFKFVQTADIDITGTLTGSIKTEQKGSQDYAKMVFSRVLAAGVSGAVAIKTGGAIINIKAFVDLIDIVKDHPSRANNQTEKDNLTELKNYLTCSEKMFSVIKGSYDDVTGNDKKKQIAAGQKILDANTSFMSSLVNGCRSSDNAASTITGAIEASGTFTLTDEIGATSTALALPGSNWSDKQVQSNTNKQGTWIPAYPTYNERLGTFALLETPELLALDFSMINYSIIRLKLNSDIKYAFNPIMNIDKENTAIFCRIVSSSDHHVTPPTLSNPYFDQHCNIIIDNNSLYKISSPFVPIDYFENTHIRFVSDKPFSTNYADYLATLKIQFKILFQSKNIGKDNKTNSSILIYTFPLNINHQVVTSYDPESPYYDLLTEYPLYNIIQETKTFDVDETFVDDEIMVYDNIVEINANLSTLPGKKVIIYSTMGFEVSPNSEISPDIELRIGYPFTKQVQPEQSYTQIESFCSNPDKYKASTFSNLAKANEEEVYKHRIESKNSNKENLSFTIYPNPNNGLFNIKFSKPAEPGTIIELTDLTGKLVYTEVLNTQIIDKLYNFSDLTTGAYFVTVKSMYGKSVQKVIVY